MNILYFAIKRIDSKEIVWKMKNLYYIVKSALAANPFIYVNLIRFLFLRNRHNFPDKRTNIFIFAFPRSGNDFAKQLTKNFNNKISISSHYHRPSMLLYAIKLKIPIIVIFRDPIEAISSSEKTAATACS